MIVHVEIELLTALNNKDKKQMYHAATMLTDDVESIMIKETSKEEQEITAEFSIKKARQADVVDYIGKTFTRNVENYNDISISFTNKQGRKKKQRKFTPKQGQYLSFTTTTRKYMEFRQQKLTSKNISRYQPLLFTE